MIETRPEGFKPGQREYGEGRTMVRGEAGGPPTTSDVAVADAASTANLTLSGAQTIDGVSVTAGMKVLVKNQSSVALNGLYTVATGAWAKIGQPKVVHVLKGALNTRLTFCLTATNTYSANHSVFA